MVKANRTLKKTRAIQTQEFLIHSKKKNLIYFEIENYLHSIDFPTDKDEILDHLILKESPDDILSTIRQLPDYEYKSLDHIFREIGKLGD